MEKIGQSFATVVSRSALELKRSTKKLRVEGWHAGAAGPQFWRELTSEMRPSRRASA